MYNVLGPHPDVLPAGEVLLWIGSWIWVPALGVAPLTHLVFPTGRPPSARWLWVAWVAIGSTILVVVSLAVAAGSLPGPALLSGPTVAGFAIPIAVAIAVFRHRLYDIDRLIHRTLGLRPPHRRPGIGVCRARAAARAGVRRGCRRPTELGGGRRHPSRCFPVPAGPPSHPGDRGSPLQPPQV